MERDFERWWASFEIQLVDRLLTPSAIVANWIIAPLTGFRGASCCQKTILGAFGARNVREVRAKAPVLLWVLRPRPASDPAPPPLGLSPWERVGPALRVPWSRNPGRRVPEGQRSRGACEEGGRIREGACHEGLAESTAIFRLHHRYSHCAGRLVHV